MAKVLAVVLNWRTAEMTLKAAASALVALGGMDAALTIVDNDSGDGSFEMIAQTVRARGWDTCETPVRVLQSGRNGGFGAGNNFGIRAGMPDGGRPDFIYILNSDAFPAPDAIHALVDHLSRHPQTGFAGSYIHGPDGQAHRTAFQFPTIASEFETQIRLGIVSRLLNRFVVAQALPTTTGRVDWLAGASLMMRQDVLDQIGLFDEQFFLYFEETDLCHRATMAGYPVDYVVESCVEHIGSVSTGMKEWQRIPQFWLDSRLYYFTKTHGGTYAAAATVAHILGGMLWRLRLMVQTKAPGDPPFYLSDLTSHAIRRGTQALFGAGKVSAQTRPAE